MVRKPPPLQKGPEGELVSPARSPRCETLLCTRAREAQAEHWADEIIEIADDSGLDVVNNGEGGYRIDGEAIQRARLRVDARKWLMSKLAPKKYGDRVTNEHTGEVSHRVVRIERVIMPMPVVERDDRKLIEASGPDAA